MICEKQRESEKKMTKHLSHNIFILYNTQHYRATAYTALTLLFNFLPRIKADITRVCLSGFQRLFLFLFYLCRLLSLSQCHTYTKWLKRATSSFLHLRWIEIEREKIAVTTQRYKKKQQKNGCTIFVVHTHTRSQMDGIHLTDERKKSG